MHAKVLLKVSCLSFFFIYIEYCLQSLLLLAVSSLVGNLMPGSLLLPYEQCSAHTVVKIHASDLLSNRPL